MSVTPRLGGERIQPKKHEHDKLDDDAVWEAGARDAQAYRPYTFLDDPYYPLDVARVFVVTRGIKM